MTQRITRQMAIAEADFLRLLPRLLDAPAIAPVSSPVQITSRKVSLQWRGLPGIRHGVMVLPQLEVTLTFLGEEQEMRDFLQVFDQTYQRGGG